MNYNHIISELQQNKTIFHSLFQHMDTDMQLWKPAPGKWCMLEIICHLYDEERDDFRTRLRHILENPEAAMQPIDPEGWVISRAYAEEHYNHKLNAFIHEREVSVAWLYTLEEAIWDNVHMHPKLGTISAHMMLANWLAHDYLHIRQIIRLKYLYLQKTTGQNLDYAGNW